MFENKSISALKIFIQRVGGCVNNLSYVYTKFDTDTPCPNNIDLRYEQNKMVQLH